MLEPFLRFLRVGVRSRLMRPEKWLVPAATSLNAGWIPRSCLKKIKLKKKIIPDDSLLFFSESDIVQQLKRSLESRILAYDVTYKSAFVDINQSTDLIHESD